MTTSGVLPDVEDRLTAPYWAAAREGRLSVQRCMNCRALRWQPATICPECWKPGGDWVDLSGRGTVYSFAVYHRAMHPAFAELVPYTVAMVEPEEGGIRMVGMVAGGAQVSIGDMVQAEFEAVTDEVTVVKWAPVGTEQG